MLCCVWQLCAMMCTHNFVKLSVGLCLGFLCTYLGLAFCVFFWFSLDYFVLVYSFCCVRFSFFNTMVRDWLQKTSPKSPILCRVGRDDKTLTQSINQPVIVIVTKTKCKELSDRRRLFVWHISRCETLLWPPCIADADIIFLPCGFYLIFSLPNLSRHRLDVYHISTHDVALVQI